MADTDATLAGGFQIGAGANCVAGIDVQSDVA